jgi:hypothetical protein
MTSHKFRVPFDTAGKKWVRFAVWDSAGNGAFTQPVHLNSSVLKPDGRAATIRVSLFL